MKSTLAERMRLALAGPPKITQKALAEACGIKPPSVNGWVSGESKTIEGANLLKAAAFLGVSAKWLAEGIGPMRETKPVYSDEDFVSIKRVDVSFSNGTGQVVYHEEDKPPLSFRADFLRKLGIPPGKAVVVDAEGESNYPKILPGAVVLINSADRENLNGDFFAFRVEGELLIKRLAKLEGAGIIATAENSDFKPKNVIYSRPEDFEVIGRAVWTGVEL
ncbi:phage repressor protein C with HTH and peptisase S24 domain [Variovorax boronicumulans]|uniref:LexA family transcriptional regulator n=1 Tax=Variovorax boronicumulans TaxID=436515 RepID=UPI00278A2D13|nr:S24 family peptidase [Variovorax boronicumulans]MDP9992005.1 phage repressor protein C with HTH and peptisase S24 domain [Variovorax boronicumulans]MDQ0001900.1 phage repressor protein C with HTH and peptisase S24 domain [Variovorax boronicumulans]